MKRAPHALAVVLGCLALSAASMGQAPAQGRTPFLLDGNRMYAELDFVRPDGSIHRALAFVDMGSPDMELRGPLFTELQLNQQNHLRFKMGGLVVDVPAADVSHDPAKPRPLGPELKLEAILPASVLQHYQVVIDYRKRQLTLARPGTLKPAGRAVPFRINAHTGLIAVRGTIDDKPYPITIDCGSAYTWLSQDVAKDWLAAHPRWQRGMGAVGPSNMMMSGDATETEGILMRLPEIALASVALKNVGALVPGVSHNFPGGLTLFQWYSEKNATPVIGWIGGNVLKNFRLFIDYPERRIYWTRQSALQRNELTDIGLTLRYEGGTFLVAGIARKDGKPTLEGVLPGDKLIRIGDLVTQGAMWGAVYDALHGKKGEIKTLVVERNGSRVTVSVPVTAF